MKKLLSLSLLLTTTTLAFAQGKLSFDIDSDNLIYLTTDTTMLLPQDATATADTGFGGGLLVLPGQSLYTGLGAGGAPGALASLWGSPTLTVALYGGASSNSLSLQATTTLSDVNNPGGIVARNVWFTRRQRHQRIAGLHASILPNPGL